MVNFVYKLAEKSIEEELQKRILIEFKNILKSVFLTLIIILFIRFSFPLFLDKNDATFALTLFYACRLLWTCYQMAPEVYALIIVNRFSVKGYIHSQILEKENEIEESIEELGFFKKIILKSFGPSKTEISQYIYHRTYVIIRDYTTLIILPAILYYFLIFPAALGMSSLESFLFTYRYLFL